MKKRIAMVCMLVTTALPTMAEATESNRQVSLRSTYLAAPLEGYRQLTLIGDLDEAGARGSLVLDPNECALNDFGDRGPCTEVAQTKRTVTFQRLRRDDPLGLNRQLWVVDGASLSGVLCLVVPEDPNGPYRLIYQSRGGERTVIAMEPLVYQKESSKEETRIVKPSDNPKCKDLPRTVDGLTSRVEVRPGFVNDTWILLMEGKKPNMNTWVEISPVVYVQQPEFWRIDVKECHSDDSVLLPTVSGYRFAEEITHSMGTKGIELHWANGETLKINKGGKDEK